MLRSFRERSSIRAIVYIGDDVESDLPGGELVSVHLIGSHIRANTALERGLEFCFSLEKFCT